MYQTLLFTNNCFLYVCYMQKLTQKSVSDIIIII